MTEIIAVDFQVLLAACDASINCVLKRIYKNQEGMLRHEVTKTCEL